MSKKPNVIIVMTDQQRHDLRKSKGYSLDTMPFLDEWSLGGIDFTNAYTPNPTCMPARVSMFTGRYASAHKVRTNHNEVDVLYTADLMDILKENGYVTALCGKNHSHHKPMDFDFAETNGHLGGEDEVNRTDEEKAFAEFLKGTKHMEVHTAAPGGVEVQFPYRNVSSCLQFIDSVEENKPFFAWVSMAEPHNPYQVPEPYFDMFPPEVLPETIGKAEHLEGKGERFTWIRDVWEEVLGQGEIEKRILRARSNYHGMLKFIDDQFKRLILGLRERGLEEDTIVIFVSDHGDFMGEYGLIRKGIDLPDLLTRIPMIWKGPGIKDMGRQEKYFVNMIDIFPTLCDILGVDIPFGCQGKSILPILQDNNIPEKEFEVAYAESGFAGLYWTSGDELTLQQEGACPPNMKGFDCLNTWTQCGEVRMLRKGNYKIQMDMMGKGYLYNLEADPYEINNLWKDNTYESIKAEMLTELMAASLRATDPIPAPHRRYRTKVHPKGYWFADYVSQDPGVRCDETLARYYNN